MLAFLEGKKEEEKKLLLIIGSALIPLLFFLLHQFIITVLIDEVLERLFTRPDGSTVSKNGVKVNISFRGLENSDIVILVC